MVNLYELKYQHSKDGCFLNQGLKQWLPPTIGVQCSGVSMNKTK